MSFQFTSRLTAAAVGGIVCCLSLSTVEHARAAVAPTVSVAATSMTVLMQAGDSLGGTAPDAGPQDSLQELALGLDSASADEVFEALFGINSAADDLRIYGFTGAVGVFQGSASNGFFVATISHVDAIDAEGVDGIFFVETELQSSMGSIVTNGLLIVGDESAELLPLAPGDGDFIQAGGGQG
ncbi:MAG: hypothetical protein RLY21_1112, partial [Planctomycetota bacterium]